MFPYFTVLYLTMIKRGFESKASEFMADFKHTIFNEELQLLQAIKTRLDLVSSLGADKFLTNKFQVRVSD